MTGRRGLLVAMVGCAVAGGLVLLAAGRVWDSATVTAATGAHVRAQVTGHDVAPGLSALGFALLVLAGALVATRSWLRRLVGLVVVVVGGATIAAAATTHDDAVAALSRKAFGVAHLVTARTLSGWAVVTIAGGVVAVLSGALTVIAGAGWPALGSRYDAPATRPVDSVASAWDALDRGEDPTD